MEIVITLVFFIIAGYWLQQGIFVYGFYTEGQPGGGFIPVLFSAMIIVFSTILLVRTLKGSIKQKCNEMVEQKSLAPLIPAGIAVVAIFAIEYLGIIVTVFLMAFSWMHWLNNSSMISSLIISVIVTLFIYAIFVLWLRVPFPRGILA